MFRVKRFVNAPRVLNEPACWNSFKFEAQTGGGQPEICRIDLYDWGPSDVGPYQPLRLGNIVLIDDALSPGIHISTRHMGHTNVLGAVNLGSKASAIPAYAPGSAAG